MSTSPESAAQSPTHTTRAWIQIHICVVLWGFTAILGKAITLAALPLVWWRMVLVSVALLLIPQVWRGMAGLTARMRLIYVGIGALVALHWLAFYSAVKLANASVAATCIATGPLFLAWIEPMVTGGKFSKAELWLGVLAVPAVTLVVGGTPQSMRMGIVAGIVAAALVAVFAALNKRHIAHADPITITAIEMSAGALLLTVVAMFMGEVDKAQTLVMPSPRDLGLLAVLAFGCTLLPFALSLVAVRHISAFGAQLATNLEPVYAIVLAIPILGEQRQLDTRFYLGVVAIMAIVFAYPLLGRGGRSRQAEVQRVD